MNLSKSDVNIDMMRIRKTDGKIINETSGIFCFFIRIENRGVI